MMVLELLPRAKPYFWNSVEREKWRKVGTNKKTAWQKVQVRPLQIHLKPGVVLGSFLQGWCQHCSITASR